MRQENALAALMEGAKILPMNPAQERSSLSCAASMSRVLLVLFCPFLVQGPAEAGSFFWTDVDEASPLNHSIKLANADGSGVSTVVSGLLHPRGMTVDSLAQKI